MGFWKHIHDYLNGDLAALDEAAKVLIEKIEEEAKDCKELVTKADSDCFTGKVCCIDYKDIMYNELHDLGVKEGDLINILFDNYVTSLIYVDKTEHGDGTIWITVLDHNEENKDGTK